MTSSHRRPRSLPARVARVPRLTAIAATVAGIAVASPAEGAGDVLRQLNDTPSVVGSDDIKSYPVVFQAYMEMEAPPQPIGEALNHNTIHPKMSGWSRIAGWAESNAGLKEAILACEEKVIFGLPYGADAVTAEFRSAGLFADVTDDRLRVIRFPYLKSIGAVTAFSTAEAYRLLEAGKTDEGLDLAVANIFLLRQCCDREFLDEQLHSIAMLSEMLSNLRDMYYTYRAKISAEKFIEISMKKLPFLRPDRSRLLIPEGDRVIAEALLDELFDRQGQPDRDKFTETFAAIQSRQEPLTRFGAARRWRMIAEVHDSAEASKERLALVYDDWWRRWRVEEYDQILDLPTQFELTNPIRYAAVIYSMQDVEQLFQVRNELLAAVYGTAMAGGLCGYAARLDAFPRATDMTYTQFARKRSDKDPFDIEFRPFSYRLLDGRHSVDTAQGRVFLEAGTPILYSKGQNHEDDRGREHTDDGAAGDIILWPPIRAKLRESGLLD